jgi:hypothetical protein
VYLLSGGIAIGRVGSVAAANTLTLTTLTVSAPIPSTNCTAAANTYQRSEINEVAWLREVKDVLTPLYKTGVNNLPGSVMSIQYSFPNATGGSIAAGTYYVVATAVDGNGIETTATAPYTVTTSGTTSTIGAQPVNIPVALNAQSVRFYVGTSSSGPFYFQSSTTNLSSNATVATSIATSGATPPTNYPGWALTALGAVETNPGSWWIDATNHILYLHARAGMPLPSNSGGGLYEAVYSNTVSAFMNSSNSDDLRLENVRCDGFSVNSASDVTTSYPIRMEQTGTGSALLVGMEAYFGAYHNIGFNNGAGTPGGIFTCISCVAGRSVAASSTNFVGYANVGGQECFYYQCETVGGGVRLDDRNNYPVNTATAAGN